MTPKAIHDFAAKYLHPYTGGMVEVPVTELRDLAYTALQTAADIDAALAAEREACEAVLRTEIQRWRDETYIACDLRDAKTGALTIALSFIHARGTR